jgi:hypothetical protein
MNFALRISSQNLLKIIEQPHNFNHEDGLKMGGLFSSKPPSYSFGPFPFDSTTIQKFNLLPNPIPLSFTLKMDNSMYVEALEYLIEWLNVESRSYVRVLKEGQTNITLSLHISIPYISLKERIHVL